jgi:hypothetical protein
MKKMRKMENYWKDKRPDILVAYKFNFFFIAMDSAFYSKRLSYSYVGMRRATMAKDEQGNGGFLCYAELKSFTLVGVIFG